MEAALQRLMEIAAPPGHEDRVRRRIARDLEDLPLGLATDRLGNLSGTLAGDPGAPSVLLFAHMDQVGFVVRRVEPDGLVRLERVGGVPVRALPGQPLVFCVDEADVPGVIASKSHHATSAAERTTVTPLTALHADVGARSAAEARALGVHVGTPAVYAPRHTALAGNRIAGTAIDDRAGCAVVAAVARALAAGGPRPTVHVAFTVQEEFNVRGAVTVAAALHPDIAMQVDVSLAADTPDMAGWGEVELGGGPVASLYAFHGRGTLNGTIPHPALTALLERTADTEGIALQRVANAGVLTDTAYVQVLGTGVACLDVGFPCRYTHGPSEVCDLGDLDALARLLTAAIRGIGQGFRLDRA